MSSIELRCPGQACRHALNRPDEGTGCASVSIQSAVSAVAILFSRNHICHFILESAAIAAEENRITDKIQNVTTAADLTLRRNEISFSTEILKTLIVAAGVAHHKITKPVLEVPVRDDAADRLRKVGPIMSILVLRQAYQDMPRRPFNIDEVSNCTEDR